MPKALLRRIGKRLDQIHPSIFHAIKLAAFPFNKYGMVNGHVEYVSPDAAELPDTRERDRKDTREHVTPPSGFRTLIALDSPYLERDGKHFRVSAGILVSAEVNLGSRTVTEYLL